jgi:hypothetical protein
MIRWLKSLWPNRPPREAQSPQHDAGARGEQTAADFLRGR